MSEKNEIFINAVHILDKKLKEFGIFHTAICDLKYCEGKDDPLCFNGGKPYFRAKIPSGETAFCLTEEAFIKLGNEE